MISEVDEEQKAIYVKKGNVNICMRVSDDVYSLLKEIEQDNNQLTATNTASGVLKPFKTA